MMFQANLASTTIGVAYFNMVGLYLRTKLTQTVLVQLWEGKAAIASKTAAANTLRQEHIVRT